MLKLIKIFSLIILFFGVQGCSKSIRDKWLSNSNRYEYFPVQYEGRTDSIAGIEAREAIDSMSFYIKYPIGRIDSPTEYQYTEGYLYDFFVHNGEVIQHDYYGNDFYGKVNSIDIENPTNGEYDYIIKLRYTGRQKFGGDIHTVLSIFQLKRGTDIINKTARIEPLVGHPERYRQSHFRQTLNPGKTLIIDGDTIKIR